MIQREQFLSISPELTLRIFLAHNYDCSFAPRIIALLLGSVVRSSHCCVLIVIVVNHNSSHGLASRSAHSSECDSLQLRASSPTGPMRKFSPGSPGKRCGLLTIAQEPVGIYSNGPPGIEAPLSAIVPVYIGIKATWNLSKLRNRKRGKLAKHSHGLSSVKRVGESEE